MSKRATHAYIGKKACGCYVFAVVDEPDNEARTAADVSEAIRSGLTIERMSIKDVREKLNMCTCAGEQMALEVGCG